MSHCVCGSGLETGECCEPLIAGRPAPTAEALMRARYTAYVKGIIDYVERTFTPEAQKDFNRLDADRTVGKVKWQGLEIKRVVDGGVDDATGLVEFVFRYTYNGQQHVQHELAKFCRKDGQWLFDGSEINPKPPPERVDKIGRNDPCSCGSGKKYKKCCGA